MIVEVTMIVKVGVSVVRNPIILHMLAGPTTKIPTITHTMVVEIATIVKIGVSVGRSPSILNMLAGSMTKIPAMT
jgi:hypothetical protein